jgi:CRISPR-associated protein Cas5t
MLKAVRIVLTAYTASFRVPGFVGHQLTLPVPPLSTIYGLLSAAAGRWILPHEVEWLAYRCEYKGKSTDLEAIVTVSKNKPDSPAQLGGRNVLRREFLVLPFLTLYLPEEWETVFKCPRYALLLGRTQDVAGVESITRVELQQVSEGTVSGVLLPWELILSNSAPAWLHNLPIAFTDGSPRRPLGMRVFGVVDALGQSAKISADDWLVKDPEQELVVPLYRREWVEKCITANL